MGVITMSFSDEVEKMIRDRALTKYGKTKGAISKTIAELLMRDSEKVILEGKWNKLMKSWEKHPLDKGGEIPYESRDELYDRY